MNKEIERVAPFVRAFLDGKQVEMCFSLMATGWKPVECLRQFDMAKQYSFRIKPKTKLRPWKPAEVPVGALIRFPSELSWHYLILSNSCYEVCFIKMSGDVEKILIESLLDCKGEYSLDYGKTWLPCGVFEI